MEKERAVNYESLDHSVSEIKLSVKWILNKLSDLSHSVDELDRRVNRFPLFFDVHDCATIFGRSTRTIKRWMDSGELECVKINGVMYVSEVELCSFLSQKFGEKIDPKQIRSEIEQTECVSDYLGR